MSAGTEPPWEEDGVLGEVGGTPALYERPFGLRPDDGVTLIAMCDRPEDHRVLGELALVVAERLGGVVDLDGLIVPRAVSYGVRREAPWSAVRPSVEAFTAAVPGKAVRRSRRRIGLGADGNGRRTRWTPRSYALGCTTRSSA